VPSVSVDVKDSFDTLKDFKNTTTTLLKDPFSTLAKFYKVMINVEEYVKGATLGVLGGVVLAGTVMGLDWLTLKGVGKGDVNQKVLTYPFKVAGSLIKSLFTRAAKIPGKTIAEVAKYPFMKAPKEIYHYIMDAKGVSKVGKCTALTLGIGTLAFSLVRAHLKINDKTADIDHRFYQGHRTV